MNSNVQINKRTTTLSALLMLMGWQGMMLSTIGIPLYKARGAYGLESDQVMCVLVTWASLIPIVLLIINLYVIRKESRRAFRLILYMLLIVMILEALWSYLSGVGWL